MHDIKLLEAHQALRQAGAVELEGILISPSVYDLEDDYGNVFMQLHWQEEHEGELLDFCVEFIEGDNQTCVVEDNNLVLVSTDGEEEVLTLFAPYHFHNRKH